MPQKPPYLRISLSRHALVQPALGAPSNRTTATYRNPVATKLPNRHILQSKMARLSKGVGPLFYVSGRPKPITFVWFQDGNYSPAVSCAVVVPDRRVVADQIAGAKGESRLWIQMISWHFAEQFTKKCSPNLALRESTASIDNEVPGWHLPVVKDDAHGSLQFFAA
jgi:hypothetical protein